MSFVHLHVHTEYSLLDGSNKIKEYVKRVKELGMTAAAITDHGVMYGVVDFYEAALKEGIKPVLGCEVYVAPGSRFDKEATGGDERYNHLILLAENNEGYKNLMKIVSIGFTEGFYYRPRVDKEVLAKYHRGLICLSACLAGALPRMIMRGQTQEAREEALWYRDTFGEGNYFLELQDHGIPAQAKVNMELVAMSRELGIPLVVTNDAHYTYASDAEAHDILLCIQTGAKVQDKERMRYEGGQFYVKSEEEMRTLFPYVPEALENTQKIAERCNVTIGFGESHLPRFDVPEGYDAKSYLRMLCEKGLEERYEPVTQELKDRLEYELSVIERMGFVDYFLIVADFINYAKENGIPVGPGRGSAAGSIVSYCLKITDIDPIRYSLLFERFLNPERVSMPDIDVDFGPERRQEVIEYVAEKYGREKVVQIVTFGTLQAKGVIRDVGRAMDIPYGRCDMLAKMVPAELGITLKAALEMNPELKALYDDDEEVHYMLDMCMRLEGLPRHTSMHAAGVVICPEAADEFVPLSCSGDGPITTQFTMTTLERLGLLKMDFLGLRNLEVIQSAVENIKKSCGKDIDPSKIDYNDPKVFHYIGTGRCEGIFQLESAGMKSFMKELKPRSLEDVIAGISLYRPGPMDMIPKYIDSKENEEHISYACEELRPILSPTYGCIVYQEQVMQIVRDLAGFSLGRSDNVRRAMSKKKGEVMAYERDIFVNGNDAEIEKAKKDGLPEEKWPRPVPGCVRKGIDAAVAEQVYDMMIDFAKYGFNKSHAACYAVVAYQTAWLKYYYPAEYMAALMTSVLDNAGKVAEYNLIARQMGLKLLPPDINIGDVGFTVGAPTCHPERSAEALTCHPERSAEALTGHPERSAEGTESKDPPRDEIIYSLSAIRGIGKGIVADIVEERSRNGLFESFYDFIERCAPLEMNKRQVENLIKAGALDCFGHTRKQLMAVYMQLMDNAQKDLKQSMSGQLSLFDLAEGEEKDSFRIKIPENMGEFSREMLLDFEKEMLGIYVSGHPLDEYSGLWERVISNVSGDLVLKVPEEGQGEEEPAVRDGESISLGGLVQEVKLKFTKRNEVMAFVTIEDLVGQAEVIVFPKTWKQYQNVISDGAKIMIEGRVSLEEDKNGKLIAQAVTPFEDIPRTLWLQFTDEAEKDRLWEDVRKILEASDGLNYVRFYYTSDKQVFELPHNVCVNADTELVEKLTKLLGEGNVRVTYRPPSGRHLGR